MNFPGALIIKIRRVTMAVKKDIDFTYSPLDKGFRLGVGEAANFSCARYNGDFLVKLADAGRAKNEFMADRLPFANEPRFSKRGSGWAPFLKFLAERRGRKRTVLPAGRNA